MENMLSKMSGLQYDTTSDFLFLLKNYVSEIEGIFFNINYQNSKNFKLKKINPDSDDYNLLYENKIRRQSLTIINTLDELNPNKNSHYGCYDRILELEDIVCHADFYRDIIFYNFNSQFTKELNNIIKEIEFKKKTLWDLYKNEKIISIIDYFRKNSSDPFFKELDVVLNFLKYKSQSIQSYEEIISYQDS